MELLTSAPVITIMVWVVFSIVITMGSINTTDLLDIGTYEVDSYGAYALWAIACVLYLFIIGPVIWVVETTLTLSRWRESDIGPRGPTEAGRRIQVRLFKEAGAYVSISEYHGRTLIRRHVLLNSFISP